MAKDYQDHVKELARSNPDLAALVAGWSSLESVLEWMKEKDFPPGSIDLIGQDEFEYDFLLELEPKGQWLAFGVT
jgi:hypothetical protein